MKMAQKSYKQERLGEVVNDLISRVKVTNLKCFLLNLLTNKIEISSYMLHPTAKDWISTNVGCDNIVTENYWWRRLVKSEAHFANS